MPCLCDRWYKRRADQLHSVNIWSTQSLARSMDGWMDFGGWRLISCTLTSIWACFATRWIKRKLKMGIWGKVEKNDSEFNSSSENFHESLKIMRKFLIKNCGVIMGEHLAEHSYFPVKSKVSKSRNNCCVPQCTSYYSDNVSFFRFPLSSDAGSRNGFTYCVSERKLAPFSCLQLTFRPRRHSPSFR